MGYLVISRKVGERLLIGADIEIMISDINGGKVDIAVNAPRQLKIEKLENHIEEQKQRGGNRARRVLGNRNS